MPLRLVFVRHTYAHVFTYACACACSYACAYAQYLNTILKQTRNLGYKNVYQSKVFYGSVRSSERSQEITVTIFCHVLERNGKQGS